MDLFTAIQVQAIRDVLAFRRDTKVREDSQYPLRRIFRWYSKTFHTPLHEVGDLPMEDVMRAYWEEHFEEMDEERLETARVDAMKSDEEREAELAAQDLAEAESLEIAEEIRQLQALADSAVTALDKLKLDKPGATPLASVIATPAPDRDATLVHPSALVEKLPEGISMTFAAEDEDLGLDEDSFSLLSRPRRP